MYEWAVKFTGQVLMPPSPNLTGQLSCPLNPKKV